MPGKTAGRCDGAADGPLLSTARRPNGAGAKRQRVDTVAAQDRGPLGRLRSLGRSALGLDMLLPDDFKVRMQSESVWRDTPVVDMALAHQEARPERSHLRFTLLQARSEADPAREHEHACFSARLGVSPDQLRCVSIFRDTLTDLDLSDTHAILVGGAGQYSVLDDLDDVRDFVSYIAWLASSDSTATLPVFASCFGFQALVMGMGARSLLTSPMRKWAPTR